MIKTYSARDVLNMLIAEVTEEVGDPFDFLQLKASELEKFEGHEINWAASEEHDPFSFDAYTDELEIGTHLVERVGYTGAYIVATVPSMGGRTYVNFIGKVIE